MQLITWFLNAELSEKTDLRNPLLGDVATCCGVHIPLSYYSIFRFRASGKFREFKPRPVYGVMVARDT